MNALTRIEVFKWAIRLRSIAPEGVKRIMIHRTNNRRRRTGVAAVEFAFVVTFIMAPVLIGLWEVGRLVDVQQLVDNAAREGARQAAIGELLDPTTATIRNISAADITNIVTKYLTNNGITTTGLTVTFTDLTNSSVTDPYQAAQLDQLQVTVQLPFDNVRYALLGKVTNVINVQASSTWYCMRDSNVTVSTTLPY
jgi:Flp pilus assembly protein TadG